MRSFLPAVPGSSRLHLLRKALFAFLFLQFFCFNQTLAGPFFFHIGNPGEETENFWNTGPLLSPGTEVTLPKHYDLEPYLFFWSYTGAYTGQWKAKSLPHFYSLQMIAPVWKGLAPNLDGGIALQVFYQFSQGQRSVQLGDIPFGFDIQLMRQKADSYRPSILLNVQANIPVGKFDRLNPKKLGTDGVGLGNWNPQASLTFGRAILLKSHHVLNPRFSIGYQAPNAFRVKGYNVYGGSRETKGTLYPGNSFWCDLGIEYSLSKNWVFACDLYYQYWNKYRFSGDMGNISPGIFESMKRPSAEQLSIAPALEYNWSKHIGLIGGVWATCAGRNSPRFITGTIALNISI